MKSDLNMEALTQYYDDKLRLIRDMTELAQDKPAEVETVLLEINQEKQFIRSELVKMKESIAQWRLELDTARK